MPRTPTFRNQRNSGFSLIELLACFAIISVLVAILIPLVGHIRGTAMASQDASNLRQLAQASNLYAAEHEGILPPTYGTVLKDGTRVVNTAWWLELFPVYVDAPNVFTSPLDDTGYDPVGSKTWTRNGVTYPEAKVSYGAMGHNSGNADFKPSGKRIARLGDPSRIVLYTNFQNAAKRLSQHWYGQHPRWITEISFVHDNGNRANVVFVDGHIALMTMEQMREGIAHKTAQFGTEAYY